MNKTVKCFIDTEFNDDVGERNFLGVNYGKRKTIVDMISIGIVFEIDCLPGDKTYTYYAVSKEFNVDVAWKKKNANEDIHWLRENVLRPIFISFLDRQYTFYVNSCNMMDMQPCDYIDFTKKDENLFTLQNFKEYLNVYGKTLDHIASEISDAVYHAQKTLADYLNKTYRSSFYIDQVTLQFYGWYSAYDWVLFCQLMGGMLNLNGVKQHCIDLRMLLDIDKIKASTYEMLRKSETPHLADKDAMWTMMLYHHMKDHFGTDI